MPPARLVLSLLMSIVIILLIAIAVVWFGQRGAIYHPDSRVPAPATVGLSRAEVVSFDTEDGLTLGAWFVPPAAAPSGYTVIVFNGNAGHRGYRADLAMALARRGMAVLLFDYRGYGGNPGLPHEAGITRDARGALAYVLARPDVDPARVVFFGESLGAAVAVRLASEHAPAALILRSPFSSLVAMSERHFPFLPARWLLRDRYPSIDLIGKVTSPVLVIAGDEDRIVGFDDSQLLYESAREPKRFVVIEGADHNDQALVAGPRVIEAVEEWLGQK